MLKDVYVSILQITVKSLAQYKRQPPPVRDEYSDEDSCESHDDIPADIVVPSFSHQPQISRPKAVPRIPKRVKPRPPKPKPTKKKKRKLADSKAPPPPPPPPPIDCPELNFDKRRVKRGVQTFQEVEAMAANITIATT